MQTIINEVNQLIKDKKERIEYHREEIKKEEKTIAELGMDLMQLEELLQHKPVQGQGQDNTAPIANAISMNNAAAKY